MISFLNDLSDEALKKESTSEAKSDTFSSIMKVRTLNVYYMLFYTSSGSNALLWF